ESNSGQRKPSNAKIEFVKSYEHVKSSRESVKKVENNKQAKYPMKNNQSPRGNKRNWNNLMTQKLGSNFEFKNKAFYVCDSFNHLIKDCDFYEKKMVEKPLWNNARRMNHQNSQRITHPHPKRNFVPRADLMKFGFKTLNTARQSSSRAAISVNTTRPINTTYTRPTVNSARTVSNVFSRAHSHVRRPFNKYTTSKNSNFNKKVNIVRENATTVGPKAAVSDNKGNEANAGNPQLELQEKGVINSGCSRHMTGNKSYLSDYEEIDGGFVAFGGNSKGGKITRKGKIRIGKLDFEDVYFVKELKFNLLSVSQMCDKKNNVLFIDTKCVVLSSDFKLTNENHVLLKVPRKDNMLGHINFKTMNKLVRVNLVRGLPLKIFENDHTCVACQKGKQHKASCKTKTVSSISQPLQMLHMDLFGPTFVKSIMKKMYCLVLTDNFGRFSWVFFLATKDETSGILKAFITEIENQISHRVNIIKYDNRTEFKNKEMNQFCKMKGIKREFSVARTPQQNGVAERKNKTLIEAARTMLADSKSDKKADEGFFVGYYVNSKAFRVFNSRTRIVEETLHITFLENKPNVARSGPEWLFDIDTLTKSMDYKPVVAGNQTNGNAGTEESIDAGQARKKTVPNDKVADDVEKKTTKDSAKEDDKDDQDLREFESTNSIYTASPLVNFDGLSYFNANPPDDPKMPNLEDTGIFGGAYDDEDLVA
ncbi:putative ribonuclease H-like domain-containing protein, partial [Tanacetum coccineum]